MNRFIAFTLMVVVLMALACQSATATADTAAVADAGLAEIDKGLEQLQAAKAKLGALDEHIAKITEALGPEGKEIYDALKAKGKATIEKGISWLKKKLGAKAAAKRLAARQAEMMLKRSWEPRGKDIIEETE